MENICVNKPMKEKIKKIILFLGIFVLTFFIFNPTSAHRSGCHRWHSCPSDTGSYTCGDLGYPCVYPTYPASGGVIYPPSGYYKECYNCPWKKVPLNDTRVWRKPLERGMYDTDVIYLQKALNKEGVYPEAIYSGYYGSFTEQAVKRFQKKYSIVSSGSPSTTGYGRAGWQTIAKLNELYRLETNL